MDKPMQLQRHALPLANAPASFKIIDTAQGALRLIFTITEPGARWSAALFILCVGLFFIFLFYFYMAGPLFCIVPVFLGLCLVLVGLLRRASTEYEYELQPDQIIFRQNYLLELPRAVSIPKAWIRSVRSVLIPSEGEGSDNWTLELVWADQKVSLLSDKTSNEGTAQWLGRVIARWAALELVWQSSSGTEMLYQSGGVPAVVPPTPPRLTAAKVSQEWRMAISVILLLSLFILIYVAVIDWLFTVVSLSLISLAIFGQLLQLLVSAWLRYRFRQEGVETEGIITQRWAKYAPQPKKDQYWLAYQFPEGAETKVKVTPEVYDAHQVGDPCQVRYLSTDPRISFIHWEVSFRFFRRRCQDDYHGRRQ